MYKDHVSKGKPTSITHSSDKLNITGFATSFSACFLFSGPVTSFNFLNAIFDHDGAGGGGRVSIAEKWEKSPTYICTYYPSSLSLGNSY